jgi:hypothetical protein
VVSEKLYLDENSNLRNNRKKATAVRTYGPSKISVQTKISVSKGIEREQQDQSMMLLLLLGLLLLFSGECARFVKKLN